MDTFAPEFSRFWLPLTERDSERRRQDDGRDDEVRRLQKAMEELAERVSAARSII